VVGRAAKQTLHRNASNTVSDMIHLIGKSFDDEDVEKIASILTCEVGRSEEGTVCYLVKEGEREKLVPVSDSLTLVLGSLHDTAEAFSGSEREMSVVVAVPPDFTAPQRNLIRSCCEAAGFDVMRIITEPSSICLAHDLGQRNKTEKSHVVVYNLGAHTLTLSLLLVAGGMYSQLATKTVRGGVGGNEFDKAITDFLTSEFEKQWKVSIRGNEKCRFKLLAAAESAKHALSRVQTTAVHVESVHDGLDLTYSLSRFYP
jgi:molecular chaperone DnaK (HSP70)